MVFRMVFYTTFTNQTFLRTVCSIFFEISLICLGYLRSLQKRASEPAETTTGSKLEPALCSLQSAETDKNSRWEIPAAHCSRGPVSANAVFGNVLQTPALSSVRKCAPNTCTKCNVPLIVY